MNANHDGQPSRLIVPLGLLGLLGVVLVAVALTHGFILPQAPARMEHAAVALVDTHSFWSGIVALSPPLPPSASVLAALILIVDCVAVAAYGWSIRLVWNARSTAVRRLVMVFGLFLLITPIGFLPHHDASFATTPMPGNSMSAGILVHDLLTRIGGQEPGAVLIVHRVASVLFKLASLLIVALVLQRLDRRRLTAGLIAFAWNPVVFIHGSDAQSGLMLLLVAIAALLWIVVGGRFHVVPLTVAAMVKLAAVPLLMVAWLRELRRATWRGLGVATLLIAVTTVLFQAHLLASPGVILGQLGPAEPGAPTAPGVVRFLLGLGLFPLLYWAALRRHRRRSSLLHGWALVLLYHALFLAPMTRPASLLMLIALVSMWMEPRMLLMTGALSLSALLTSGFAPGSPIRLLPPDALALPAQLLYLLPPTVVAAAIGGVAVYRILHRESVKPMI